MFTPPVRTSAWHRARPLVVVGVLFGGGAAGLWWMHASAERDAEARREADRQADARDKVVAGAIRTRLTGLRGLDLEAAPETCPTAVTGELALVDAPWLAWVLDGAPGKAPPSPYALRSPVFEYLAGAWTPSGTYGYAHRHDLYEALRVAPYVVIASAETTPIKLDGTTSFEGGVTVATLAVAEVATNRLLCKVLVTSAPDTLVAVRDKATRAKNWDLDTAQKRAVADAFWAAAADSLTAAAPHATLAPHGED